MEEESKNGLGNGLCMEIVHRKDRLSPMEMTLSDIPMFAKLRRGKQANGQDILDIHYFALMAYSGPNRVFSGVHVGDYEQIIVRCTTEGHLISGEQFGHFLYRV